MLAGRQHKVSCLVAFFLVRLRPDRIGKEPVFPPHGVVVILAALPAELDRQKQFLLPRLKLTFQRKFPLVGLLEGCKQRPALADELMEFEGQCSIAVWPSERPANQHLAEPLLADVPIYPSLFRKLLGHLRQRARHTALETSIGFLHNAQFILHPAHEWMAAKRLEIIGDRRLKCRAKSLAGGHSPLAQGCQRLFHHIIGCEGVTEKQACEVGHRLPSFQGGGVRSAIIVALVPMWTRSGPAQRSLRRRTSIATSAP